MSLLPRKGVLDWNIRDRQRGVSLLYRNDTERWSDESDGPKDGHVRQQRRITEIVNFCLLEAALFAIEGHSSPLERDDGS